MTAQRPHPGTDAGTYIIEAIPQPIRPVHPPQRQKGAASTVDAGDSNCYNGSMEMFASQSSYPIGEGRASEV